MRADRPTHGDKLNFTKAVCAAALGAGSLGAWTSFATTKTNPHAPPVVTLTAHDYFFDPVPDIPSGVVELRLHNVGKDFHHAAIFKLARGHTASQFVAALKNPGPPPVWATPVPGPNAPPVGETQVSFTDLTPGNYIVMCFIDTNGGLPHFMKGMYRPFRVVASGNRSRAPKADVDISLMEYGFKFSSAPTAGVHTFRLSNTGAQPHEIEIFRLDDGKTLKEFDKWLLGPMTTEAPAAPVGGVVNVPPGAHPVFTATLTPGRYVADCFIPDAKDGKPHILHGMEYAFEVK
jgi:hypothetical protein